MYPHYQRPNRLEHLLNRGMGALVRLGIGPRHLRVLEVQGRKSGKRYSLPVDLLVARDRLYLVSPRGYTQWARNAEAAGGVTLRRGSRAEAYRLRILADDEKPAVLKAYLDRFRREVQRFFPVPAGSPVGQFQALVARYPAYELLPVAGDRESGTMR
jgi:deazaflavin-dependent oxidoreductase (nitroreductase family)